LHFWSNHIFIDEISTSICIASINDVQNALYWTESESECIEISELKQDEVEFISKSQEVQRQTHADISNIEQSAKTLNSIQKIKISHFKKSWDQEIEYLTKLQIEFAKSETRETINMHYRKLERITKETKNIVMYINASQIQKKIAEIKTEIKTTVIFTHEFVRCSKATSVSDKIIITKAKLQAISDAIVMCSEKALKISEI